MSNPKIGERWILEHQIGDERWTSVVKIVEVNGDCCIVESGPSDGLIKGTVKGIIVKFKVNPARLLNKVSI